MYMYVCASPPIHLHFSLSLHRGPASDTLSLECMRPCAPLWRSSWCWSSLSIELADKHGTRLFADLEAVASSSSSSSLSRSLSCAPASPLAIYCYCQAHTHALLCLPVSLPPAVSHVTKYPAKRARAPTIDSYITATRICASV